MERRKLHNEELSYLYSSPNEIRVIKSRKMRWAVHVRRRGRGEVHIGFWLKPKGKIALERPRRRWENRIKTDLQKVGCGERHDLAQDR